MGVSESAIVARLCADSEIVSVDAMDSGGLGISADGGSGCGVGNSE